MGGWLLIIWGIPAALGAIVFLKLVANSVAFVESDLERLAKVERSEYEKRKKRPDDGVLVVGAAGGGSD